MPIKGRKSSKKLNLCMNLKKVEQSAFRRKIGNHFVFSSGEDSLDEAKKMRTEKLNFDNVNLSFTRWAFWEKKEKDILRILLEKKSSGEIFANETKKKERFSGNFAKKLINLKARIEEFVS